MKRAFTLIELLVVVLIIGILSAVALPQYQKAVNKTRLMESLIQGRALMTAQREFMMANGTFATDLSMLSIETPVNKWTCVGSWCKARGINGAQLQISFWPSQAKVNMQCIAEGTEGDELCKSLGGTYSYTNEGSDTNYYTVIPYQ